MKPFRSIKSLFVLQAAVLMLLIVASHLRILQLHYPHAVENDPLLSPFRVRTISGNMLTLEDGRVLHLETSGEPLDQIIRRSDFQVDLEPGGEESCAVVYAKRRGWICGTPWCGLIEIPLIADNVPINHREPIGFARIVGRDAELEP